jgi:hypothetical protein
MINGFIASIIVALAFVFGCSYMIVFVVSETEGRQDARHLQRVSGMRFLPHWASLLTFDLASAVPLMLSTIAVLSTSKTFGGGGNGFPKMVAVTVAICLYVPAQVLLTYLCSGLYTDYSKAQVGGRTGSRCSQCMSR